MIILISISAANATDITNSTTDITAYDENQLQNDEIPVDSSSKLIKELSDANDNDIITLEKGTYKIRIKVRASGDGNYRAKVKTVIIKININTGRLMTSSSVRNSAQ